MKLRPALLTFVFVLGCTETNYGYLGRTGGGPTTTKGTTTGNGGAPGTTTSSSGSTGGPGTTTGSATTTSSGTTGSGGAAATSSSSGNGSGGASTTTSGAGGTGGSPYDTPPVCTSMMNCPVGNGADMLTGAACKSCHVLGGQASGKTFDIGGTVYPTAHEPDNCDGVNVSGAVVVITDANNAQTQLPVNSVGNFYHYDLFGFAALKTPLKAEVQYNGQVRKMLTPITNGDCNSCHTENGAQNAPGRIMLP